MMSLLFSQTHSLACCSSFQWLAVPEITRKYLQISALAMSWLLPAFGTIVAYCRQQMPSWPDFLVEKFPELAVLIVEFLANVYLCCFLPAVVLNVHPRVIGYFEECIPCFDNVLTPIRAYNASLTSSIDRHRNNQKCQYFLE